MHQSLFEVIPYQLLPGFSCTLHSFCISWPDLFTRCHPRFLTAQANLVSLRCGHEAWQGGSSDLPSTNTSASPWAHLAGALAIKVQAKWTLKSEKRGPWPTHGKKKISAQIIPGIFYSTFPDLFPSCWQFTHPFQHTITSSFLKGMQSLLVNNLAIPYHICLWVRDRTNGTAFPSESRSGSDISWEVVALRSWVITAVLYKLCFNSNRF